MQMSSKGRLTEKVVKRQAHPTNDMQEETKTGLQGQLKVNGDK